MAKTKQLSRTRMSTGGLQMKKQLRKTAPGKDARQSTLVLKPKEPESVPASVEGKRPVAGGKRPRAVEKEKEKNEKEESELDEEEDEEEEEDAEREKKKVKRYANWSEASEKALVELRTSDELLPLFHGGSRKAAP